MIEEDVIKDELILAETKKESPLSPKELYERTGLSPIQVSMGIKILLMKKQIKVVQKDKECAYQFM